MPKNGQAMGENMETGNVGQKGQATLNVTRTHMLPCVSAEMPENG
jgi:hypothetical protein